MKNGRWKVFKELLPRIYMIVYEINERWCRDLWNRYPGEWDKIKDMAIIADGFVHMAHLAVVGSYSVNGVAKIHTEILKKSVLANFYEYSPSKFNNKTNGITHRRWLMKANPELSALISETIGKSWMSHATDLLKLTPFATDPVFAEKNRHCEAGEQRAACRVYQKNHRNDYQSAFDIRLPGEKNPCV